MSVDLTVKEITIAINALRVLRSQQQVIAQVVAAFDPKQVADGIRMVTDLEAKLVAHRRKAEGV